MLSPRRRKAGRMSLTPLIDCVFILLVFFMLQTNFMKPRAMEFSQATGSAKIENDSTMVVVEVHENGSLWLNSKESSLDGLKEYAAGLIAPAQTRVMLAVDEEVLLQAAVDVMDLFNQFDVHNISVSATQRFAQ
ncbi:MAG: ExbD/TolR family protein [Gammaproteobacteria bacterium]